MLIDVENIISNKMVEKGTRLIFIRDEKHIFQVEKNFGTLFTLANGNA